MLNSIISHWFSLRKYAGSNRLISKSNISEIDRRHWNHNFFRVKKIRVQLNLLVTTRQALLGNESENSQSSLSDFLRLHVSRQKAWMLRSWIGWTLTCGNRLLTAFRDVSKVAYWKIEQKNGLIEKSTLTSHLTSPVHQPNCGQSITLLNSEYLFEKLRNLQTDKPMTDKHESNCYGMLIVRGFFLTQWTPTKSTTKGLKSRLIKMSI